jgi:hypothetical protein
MQDDFNSAATAPDQPSPGAPGQPRPAGQPLGVIPPHASPGQGQAGGWAGPTASYHGSQLTGPQTVADPQPPAAWPGAPNGTAAGKPPIYVPPGLPPVAPPVAPLPMPAPQVAPPFAGPTAPVAQRVPARISRPPMPPSRAVAPQGLPSGQPGQPRRWAAWVPLPHTLLLAGVALLFIATLLPWGVDSSGSLIMLHTASVPAFSTQGGDGTALQIAYDLIGAVGVLSLALLLSNVFLSGLNRLLGRGCVAGCALVPLYPILLALILALIGTQVLAAGFGGLSALAQAPGAQSYGIAGLGVAHYELGYYFWYTGIIVNVIGMLGELVVWRR